MTLPTEFQDTLNNLNILYDREYKHENSDNFKIFREFAEKQYKLAYNNSNNNDNKKLIESIIKPHLNKYIKENKIQIPKGILPDDKIGFLTDINVQMSNQQRKMEMRRDKNVKSFTLLSDDYIYKYNQEIQENIPRGLTMCEIMNANDNTIDFQDICIYGNKKFTGFSNQDEDVNINSDGNVIDEIPYFIQDPELNKEKIIVFMMKINGEALHFSGRYIYDKFYLFVGSKKNHIMISKEKDIDLYTDERYTNAKKFAKIFMTALKSLPQTNLKYLYNLLHYTKVTAVCEILQPSYQHVVYIPEYDGDHIVFLCFAPFYNGEKNNNNSLTAFPPQISGNIMHLLGITCASSRIHRFSKETNEKEEPEFKESRKMINCEGFVLYYLNEKNETIGLVKLKTIWYICLRALREKMVWYLSEMKKPNKKNDEDFLKSINKRYDEIQKWLTLKIHEIEAWKYLAKQFMKFLKKYQDKEGRFIQPFELRSKFPIFWLRFITWTKGEEVREDEAAAAAIAVVVGEEEEEDERCHLFKIMSHMF